MAVSVLSGAALAQGARYDSVAQTTSSLLGVTVAVPVPSAAITVCNFPATGQTSSSPCTNTATIYTDQTVTVSATNPTTADQQGNFGFWVKPGSYDYSVCTTAPVRCAGPYHVIAPVGSNGLVTNLIASGTISGKDIEGVKKCEQFADVSHTTFDLIMAACVVALPATGPRVADATNLSSVVGTFPNALTMTAPWVISNPNGLTALFGDYAVNQAANSITCPAPCNNLGFRGTTPYVTTSAGPTNGTIFKYTGSGVAHDFGDATGGTSFGHLFEDIGFDMTGASGSAIAIRTTRGYGERFSRVRGLCPVAANTMTFIQNNGGTGAPGSQSSTYEDNVENNCQFGVVITASFTSPPGCNNQRFGVNQFSGNSAAGSIGIDIECGNDVDLGDPYIGGYDHGVKVATPSSAAVHGFVHAESCGTDGISFALGTAGNWLQTDTSCAITDAVGASSSNTVIGVPNGAHTVFFGGSPLQLISFGNFADAALNTNLQAGTSADQQVNINFKDKSNATKWIIQKDTANAFKIQSATGINRFQTSSNNTIINSESTAAVQINAQGSASTGTGGLQIASGGASPVVVAQIDGNGVITSKGTAAVITGTGACATIGSQLGGQVAGSASCTGVTAASTLTITFLTTAPHGYACSVQDETTRANLFQQTSHSTTTCVLTATSVTQNDVFVFSATAF